MTEEAEVVEIKKEDDLTGVVNIQGKLYVTVARRIQDFRKDHPDWSVVTEIMSAGAEHVLLQAKILDENGRLVATGHAEESRDDSFINKTSAIENAETSAIGRALAALGYGSEFYASANEVQNAEQKKAVLHALEKGIRHGRAFEIYSDLIQTVKDSINSGNYQQGADAWFGLSHDEMADLWLAPTKGGVFSTREREIMKSNAWRDAHFGPKDANPEKEES